MGEFVHEALDITLPYFIFPGPSWGVVIPCDGIYVGTTVAIQGVDFGGSGPCSNARVSDTIVIQIQ